MTDNIKHDKYFTIESSDVSHLLIKLQDPIFFIQEILQVQTLTKDQKKIIESVFHNKFTGVKAAHGVGKTFIAACITLAFLVPNPDSIVITTAPSMRQVRDLLWNEIAKLYHHSKYPLGGELLQTKYVLGPKWYAEGISTEVGKEEQSAVKLQGYHASKLLVIVDEAVGIHPTIWEAIDGITSSDNSAILAIGNPSTTQCQFYKNLLSSDWKSFAISALNHPNVKYRKEVIKGAVSYQWVKDKIRKWCHMVGSHNEKYKTFEFEGNIYKPNNLFLWKVLGEFPVEETDKLIPMDKIANAIERDTITGIDIRDMAIDVARYGGDASTIAFNNSNNFTIIPYYNIDVYELASEAINKIKEFKPYRVVVDCDGLGAGVFDIIKNARDNYEIKDENGEIIDFELHELHSSASPQQTKNDTMKFNNLRTQMWYVFSQDLDFIKLPDDEDLIEELNAPKVRTDRFGRLALESKEDIRKSLGKSTDKADAVVYCNYLKYMKQKDIKYFFL